MAGEKFLKEQNGQITEIPATQLGGSGNENKIPSLNADGFIDPSMLPPGAEIDLAAITASESLSSGDFVNIWNDAGTPKVRKALAEDGKTADGFVLDNFALNDAAKIYFEGRNTAVNVEGGGSLTGGLFYYLSDTTAGTVTATAPSTSTKHVQKLGKAYSATSMTTEGLAQQTIKKA